MGTIFDIQRYCVNDGNGIRSVVFFKGCPLRCKWCHNIEGILPISTFENHSVKKEINVEDLTNELLKDKEFFIASNGGVTISGGEPLMQDDFLISLVDRLHEKGINVAIETSGYVDEKVFKKCIYKFDEVMFDIKLLNDEKFKTFTTGKLENVLNNLKILDDLSKEYVLRIPLIKGVNYDEIFFNELNKLLKGLKNVTRVDLLPFNELAKSKYDALGMNLNDSFSRPSSDELIVAKNDISKGLDINVCIL